MRTRYAVVDFFLKNHKFRRGGSGVGICDGHVSFLSFSPR